MKRQLIVEASNNGDLSVGIEPAEVKITIESNCDAKDILTDIKYKDNENLFKKDITDLLIAWIDDIPFKVNKIYVK